MVHKAVLDYTLVPLGLALMAAYHAWLLHRLVKHPSKTVMGLDTINRRLWVQAMIERSGKDGVLAVQTLRNSIMASTLLATAGIMLSSLIAVLMSNSSGMSAIQQGGIVFGEQTEVSLSVKYFSILICFLVAFLMNVQSIRYFSLASILVNVPLHRMTGNMSPEYVARLVNRGSHFGSAGLRAFYFSLPMLMWIFGPIPMLGCCVVLVFLLYFLDFAFNLDAKGGEIDVEEGKGDQR